MIYSDIVLFFFPAYPRMAFCCIVWLVLLPLFFFSFFHWSFRGSVMVFGSGSTSPVRPFFFPTGYGL